MAKVFAVTRKRGPRWDASRGLEAQESWTTHAAFMNGLQSEGFVVLGGPLEGTNEVLLIIRAEDEAEIRSRLAADPWTTNGLLDIARIAPWTIRLGKIAT
jgi:uncharacterized protein YciI